VINYVPFVPYFSPFTIGLNTFIVSRLEFFGITFDAHPHSGWFICLAPCRARRTNSHIIKKIARVFLIFLIKYSFITLLKPMET